MSTENCTELYSVIAGSIASILFIVSEGMSATKRIESNSIFDLVKKYILAPRSNGNFSLEERQLLLDREFERRSNTTASL